MRTLGMHERRASIVELVNREGRVTFAQLKRAYPDVSEMTLRTDLKTLDDERKIIRVHGGAKSVGYAIGTDDLLARRSARNVEEKRTIAIKAAGLIRPNTTIFIDSGSSTTMLASVIEDMPLLVFTNSISVAAELTRLQQAECHLIGGRLNSASMSTIGGRTIANVTSLSFGQLFLGVTGYTRGDGFTCGFDDEAIFKSTLIERAAETIVLMDSSKEGRHTTFPICGLERVDVVVSDSDVSQDFQDACTDAGVRLL